MSVTDMDATILGAWMATGLTLFIFSFLYQDNPLLQAGRASVRGRVGRVHDRQGV